MSEREELRRLIDEWNRERWDMFALSEPDERLDFHGAMKFYFHDVGQKVTTKVIRVSSTATARNVIEALVDKFHPDMRMLTRPEYCLWELHETGEERELQPAEKPLLVQLTWHKHKRDGRFLLHPKGLAPPPLPPMAYQDRPLGHGPAADTTDLPDPAMKRKLSRREKKEAKKAAKQRETREAEDAPSLASSLFSHVPPTTFTRTISNPEIVMKKRRERKLQQKLNHLGDGDALSLASAPPGRLEASVESEPEPAEEPTEAHVPTEQAQTQRAPVGVSEEDTELKVHLWKPATQPALETSFDALDDDGGSLKVFGASLNAARPYVTVLVAGRERADKVLLETLEKYGLDREDPGGFRLVRVQSRPDGAATETVLSPDDCPLLLLANEPNPGQTEFHVRRAESGSRGPMGGVHEEEAGPLLVELNPDGSEVTAGQPRRIPVAQGATQVGSERSLGAEGIQLFGPYVHPRHCVLSSDGQSVTLSPLSPNAQLALNGQPVRRPVRLTHNSVLRIGQSHLFRFLQPHGAATGAQPPRPLSNPSFAAHQPRQPAPPQQRAVWPAEQGSEADSTSDSRRFKPKPKPRASMRESRRGSTASARGPRSDSLPPDGRVLLRAAPVPQPRASRPAEEPPRPNSILFKSKTLESLTRPMRVEESAMETTFDVGGDIVTRPHFGPLPVIHSPHSQLSGSVGSLGVGGVGGRGGRGDAIPAIVELVEEAEESLLSAVLRDLDPAAVGFKLAPAYTLYATLRYRVSPHYRTSLMPAERAERLRAFLAKTAALLHVVVQDHCHNGQALAFWMANASELLNFVKLDRDMGPRTAPEPQESVAEAVEKAFAHLGACLKEELNGALPAFLDGALEDDAAVRPTLLLLSSSMTLLRHCRVNAALTIQLFSQLFHYINCYLFNWLVSEEGEGWLRRSWGERLSARLGQIQAWSLKQGLELAAECHLDRLVQALQLLQTSKDMDGLAGLGATCYKLNSLQVHHLLSRYAAEPDEAAVEEELVQSVVSMAQAHADDLAASEGRSLALEEEPELGLPFLLPEDGYSPDLVKGIPPPLQLFIDSLLAKGICRMILQPNSTGSWTVHLQPPSALRRQSGGAGGGGETVQITFPKSPQGGIGLSIVCAQGEGEGWSGIYVKKVVEGSAAERDGRLEAGDQLLAVNGAALVGVEQEEAARLMAASGPSVSFEVRKQAALYNGLATWLYSSSPSASPRSARQPPPGVHNYHNLPPQRQGSLSSLHSSQPYRAPAQPPAHHQRPPSVHSAADYSHHRRSPAPHTQLNPGYGSPVSVRSNGFHNGAAEAMSRSTGPAGGGHFRQNSLPAQGPAAASPLSLSMDANLNGLPPNGDGIFRAPGEWGGGRSPASLRREVAVPRSPLLQSVPRPLSSPLGVSASVDVRAPPPRLSPAAQPPRAVQAQPRDLAHSLRQELNGVMGLNGGAQRHGTGQPAQRSPPRAAQPPSPSPDYPQHSSEPLRLGDESWRGATERQPAAAEEPEALEARMNLELIRMMEEEVGRLEAKEFLSEPEQRRYRAIKYDLAYKRRLQEDAQGQDDSADASPQDPDPDQPYLHQLSGFSRTPAAQPPVQPPVQSSGPQRLQGGRDQVNDLEDQVERSMRLDAAPTKRAPPAVPPKKKTVQFQPPASVSGSSTSPRSEGAASEDSPVSLTPQPPVGAGPGPAESGGSYRYVFQSSETETPRAQVIGAQEVYRDPRAQRLARLAASQGPSPSGPDASGLAFRDKMRIFAQQLGEHTPKQGAKSSKAQREIETTILTPQS